MYNGERVLITPIHLINNYCKGVDMTTNIVSKSKKGCSVDGCHGKHKAKELGGKHYQRERNHGSTDEIKRKRQLIYGHGINDADYSIMTEVNGKQVKDPFYRKWTAMLERCYCDKSL